MARAAKTNPVEREIGAGGPNPGWEQDQVPHSRSAPRSRPSHLPSTHVIAGLPTTWAGGTTRQVQLLNKDAIWTCQSMCNDRRRWPRQCSEVQQFQLVHRQGHHNFCLDAETDPSGSKDSRFHSCSPLTMWSQVEQETVAISGTQFIDRAVNVPLVTQRRVLTIQKIQKTVEIRWRSSC